MPNCNHYRVRDYYAFNSGQMCVFYEPWWEGIILLIVYSMSAWKSVERNLNIIEEILVSHLLLTTAHPYRILWNLSNYGLKTSIYSINCDTIKHVTCRWTAFGCHLVPRSLTPIIPDFSLSPCTMKYTHKCVRTHAINWTIINSKRLKTSNHSLITEKTYCSKAYTQTHTEFKRAQSLLSKERKSVTNGWTASVSQCQAPGWC